MTLEEYNTKISNRQISDVINTYNFIKSNSKEILESDFFEYFYLYKDFSDLSARELGQINRITNHEKIKEKYSSNKKYKSFEELKKNR